ncbi:MAG: hypothetical protein GXO82_10805 [Chlorobi bacterium]|nr:hypothetical protein [Chlorobiota bacterium]
MAKCPFAEELEKTLPDGRRRLPRRRCIAGEECREGEFVEAGLTGVPVSGVLLPVALQIGVPSFSGTWNVRATTRPITLYNETPRNTVDCGAFQISEPGLYAASGGGGCSVSITDIYEGANACKQCLGWKRVDDGEKQSWKYWAELPAPIRLAVTLGLVRPVECPRCHGTGREPQDD